MENYFLENFKKNKNCKLYFKEYFELNNSDQDIDIIENKYTYLKLDKERISKIILNFSIDNNITEIIWQNFDIIGGLTFYKKSENRYTMNIYLCFSLIENEELIHKKFFLGIISNISCEYCNINLEFDKNNFTSIIETKLKKKYKIVHKYPFNNNDIGKLLSNKYFLLCLANEKIYNINIFTSRLLDTQKNINFDELSKLNYYQQYNIWSDLYQSINKLYLNELDFKELTIRFSYFVKGNYIFNENNEKIEIDELEINESLDDLKEALNTVTDLVEYMYPGIIFNFEIYKEQNDKYFIHSENNINFIRCSWPFLIQYDDGKFENFDKNYNHPVGDIRIGIGDIENIYVCYPPNFYKKDPEINSKLGKIKLPNCGNIILSNKNYYISKKDKTINSNHIYYSIFLKCILIIFGCKSININNKDIKSYLNPSYFTTSLRNFHSIVEDKYLINTLEMSLNTIQFFSNTYQKQYNFTKPIRLSGDKLPKNILDDLNIIENCLLIQLVKYRVLLLIDCSKLYYVNSNHNIDKDILNNSDYYYRIVSKNIEPLIIKENGSKFLYRLENDIWKDKIKKFFNNEDNEPIYFEIIKKSDDIQYENFIFPISKF